MKKYIILLLSTVLLFSCEDDLTQHEKDIEKIKEYLQEQDIEAESTDSGLHYTITSEGNGPVPHSNSIVEIKYKGSLMEDGTVFDEGVTKSFLKNYIEGWIEGLQFFKEGSKGMLFVPSSLGYGAMGRDPVPPNSILIFDVELLYVATK